LLVFWLQILGLLSQKMKTYWKMRTSLTSSADDIFDMASIPRNTSAMATIQRSAVRAVILTPDAQMLLIRAEEPASKRSLWITPGGGLENGECAEAALTRELYEETGLCDANIGPKIWQRKIAFTWAGVDYLQTEAFFLIKSPRFTPTMEFNPAPEERTAFRESRWWAIQEIRESQDLFAPQRMAELLQDLMIKGPSAEVLDVTEFKPGKYCI
jgi:ADP-ribose pyrophosphatase YjhB (NUDIX family)